MREEATPGGSLRGKRVVVSACLLGRNCRYDGGNRLEEGLEEALAGAGAEIVAVCPETEAGLGVPRPPMDLHETAEGTRVVRVDGTDCTAALEAGVARIVARLQAGGEVTAFFLKSKSPSCGAGGEGKPAGLFTRAVRAAFPGAAIVEVRGGRGAGAPRS